MRTRSVEKKGVRPEDVRDVHEIMRLTYYACVTYMKLPLKLICMFTRTTLKLISLEKNQNNHVHETNFKIDLK
jgi:hypothetical protein